MDQKHFQGGKKLENDQKFEKPTHENDKKVAFLRADAEKKKTNGIKAEKEAKEALSRELQTKLDLKKAEDAKIFQEKLAFNLAIARQESKKRKFDPCSVS